MLQTKKPATRKCSYYFIHVTWIPFCSRSLRPKIWWTVLLMACLNLVSRCD